MRIAALLFVALCLGSWAPHPLKMSTCTLTPAGTDLQIKVRLFTDDFTAHMEDVAQQRKLNFENAGKKEAKAVADYFQDHFILQCNGKALPLQLTKVVTEEYNLVTAVFLTISIAPCQTLTLRNTLMMDAFENQKNLVILKGPNPKTFEITAANSLESIPLK